MEHFDMVFALARMALNDGGDRAIQQLERLRDTLAKGGDEEKEQAAKISRLISRESKRANMSPMAFDEMRATAEAARKHLPGETLSRSVPLPHDKETGAPLANILFPESMEVDAPVLGTTLAAAIED